MPRPRKHAPPVDALVGTAALTARWVERLLAAHDPALTVGQYLALRSIDREPLTAAELARRAGVSGPAVSQLVAGLESAGWIERSQISEDRRQQALSLTAAGEVALVSASVLLRERIGPLLAELPPPELDALDRLLGLLESALAGTPPPRRPHPPPPPPHDPEGHPPRPR